MIASSIFTNVGKQIASGVAVGVGIEAAIFALKNVGRVGKAAQTAYEAMEDRARVIRNERKLREMEKIKLRLKELEAEGRFM